MASVLRRGLYTSPLFRNVPLATEAGDTATAAVHVPLRSQEYQVRVASILTRNPLIVRSLSQFEGAYEEYRQALQSDYARGIFDIQTAHKQELATMGSSSTAPSIDANAKDKSGLSEEYMRHEGDSKSLKRKLERKLYFVVQDEQQRWIFPSTPISTADVALNEVSLALSLSFSHHHCPLGRLHHAEDVVGRARRYLSHGPGSSSLSFRKVSRSNSCSLWIQGRFFKRILHSPR